MNNKKPKNSVKNVKTKKNMILTIVLVGIIMVLALLPGILRKNKQKPEKTNWGTIKEEEVSKNKVKKASNEEQKKTTTMNDNGEYYVDDFGLTYKSVNIPHMNISTMIPEGWTIDVSDPNYIYVKSNDKEKYNQVEIGITAKPQTNQKIGDLAKNMNRKLFAQFRYENNGIKLYPSHLEDRQEDEDFIYDGKAPVWFDDSDDYDYKEFLEKPANLPNAKKGNKFIAYTQYGVDEFKEAGNALGVKGTMFYAYSYFMLGEDQQQFISVVGPRAIDDKITEIQNTIIAFTQEAKPIIANYDALTKYAIIGDIKIPMPSSFEKITGDLGETGYFACTDINKDVFGTSLHVFDIKFTSEETKTVDAGAPEFAEYLAKSLSNEDIAKVAETLSLDPDNIFVSYSDPSLVKTGIGKYADIVISLRNKNRLSESGLNIDFPVQGNLYVVDQGDHVTGFFLPYHRNNKELVNKIGDAIANKVSFK